MSGLDSITDSMDMNLGKLWKIVKDQEAWNAAVWGEEESWIQLRDCTKNNRYRKHIWHLQSSWNYWVGQKVCVGFTMQFYKPMLV